MKKLFYFLCIAVCLCSCDKQDTQEFELGSLQKILDGYFVTSIAFDSKGNAWIGTFQQGIIRYNEEETMVYNSDNSVFPKDCVIWDVAVDNNDNVWMGSDDGMWKYDGKEFALCNAQNTAMPEDAVRTIAVDSKNNIWLTSCRFRRGGIVKFDGSEWKAYTPDNSALPDNLINDIAIDQSDNVWLTVNDYLVKVSNNKWEVYTKDDLGLTNFIFSGIQFNSNNLLLGIIDHSFNNYALQPPCELYIFDGKKTTLLSNVNNITSIPGQTKITIDHHDNVWCYGWGANDFGVWRSKGKQLTIINRSEFGDSNVYTIKEAPDYRMWFGTIDGIYIR